MGKHKRILSGALAAALALTAAGTALPVLAAAGDESMTRESYYADVDGNAWYAEAVAYCAENGLMNGISDVDFDPYGSMTRSMLATVLYRMAGSPEVTAANPFTDVVTDSWYGPAVIWAAGQGLVDGYGDGRYGPADDVTREQLAVFLWKYEGRPGGSGDAGFLDGESISGWAADAVNWTWAEQYMNLRSEGYFHPGQDALRYELAYALMNYSRSKEPEPDPDPEPEPEPEINIWEEFQQTFGYLPAANAVRQNGYISEAFQLMDYSWSPDGETVRFMTYAYAPYTIGIDVSSHQKDIDWQQVAASGVRFAIIRAGYRGYTKGNLNLDPYFQRNIEGALAAGLQVGVYFFSQATTVAEAIEEAQYTIDLIRSYSVTYPVVFDWERQDYDTSRTQKTSEETVAACAVAFCETVKAAGYTPMFYASPSKVKKMADNMGYLADYPFWLAHYTKEQIPSSYTNHFDMWQYSSKWSVPGISGNVDVNICLTPNWNGGF